MKKAMSWEKSSPSFPARLSAGTRTSFKTISAVSEARIPILPWILTALKPGVSVESKKKLCRRWREGFSGIGETKDQHMVGQGAGAAHHCGGDG